MKTARFEVLSPSEIEQIHSASMEVLAEVGVKVDYKTARDLFKRAGARVDESGQKVFLTEELVFNALEQAPENFILYGSDPDFQLNIGSGQVNFAALGTPTSIIDLETGERRPTTLADTIRHIQLINACEHIHNSQMDIWPNDIPMTTIHAESIWAWIHNSRKPFGMGCYGFLPTLDMMEMMSIAVGGKEELQQRPRFFSICSVVSPLQMTQMQIEGMLLCADYGQPVAMSPEAIAGATAPVTLAGLLIQQNANILAHITLSQIYRPGTPVLYGTVSTIANMRSGAVILGAVETGLITAASAQLARYYKIPIRSVGGTTESKLEDVQAGMERTYTLIQAVLAGVDFITCAGTLDSTMMESDAMLILDDELCGAALRMARGIDVDEERMALDAIKTVGSAGHYLAQPHTAKNFRTEHFMPGLMVRDPYDTWVNDGKKSTLDRAREKALEILSNHQAYHVDASVEAELQSYRERVAERSIEDFYAYEDESKQTYDHI